MPEPARRGGKSFGAGRRRPRRPALRIQHSCGAQAKPQARAHAAPPRPQPLQLACHIITRSDREHPADALLRHELKADRSLTPAERRTVTRAVFSYFRWFGWLNARDPLLHRLHQARELANSFAAEPGVIAEADLLTRAVPAWLRNEMEVTAAWTRSLQSEPVVWLRARRSEGEKLARALRDCRAQGPGPLADALAYSGEQDLFVTPEFHRGAFELQDISSQAVGLVCAPKSGETWWDACAGEGGKLLHLSDLMENKGLIWASDAAEWRLRRLKRRAARAGAFNYRLACWAGEAKLPTKTRFDGVLVDAPCSGVGTWNRNPHARWTLRPEDIAELAALQSNLLRHAASAVKPGGKLVYSVCTLTGKETEEVAARFSSEFPDFNPLSFENPLAASAAAEAKLLLWPQQCRGNGMFIAVWQRSS